MTRERVMGEVERGKTVVKIYCMREYVFSKKYFRIKHPNDTYYNEEEESNSHTRHTFIFILHL